MKTFTFGWALSIGLLLAQPEVPRAAPELRIVEPSGKTTLLSGYRGKVVLLALVSTQCPHCKSASQDFERIQHEFNPAALQVLEVAMDSAVNAAAYRTALGITFPVGFLSGEDALKFLGLPRGRVGTPQVVLIDRRGIIRAQSERYGSPQLQSAGILRALIRSLIAPGAGPGAGK